MYTLGETIIVYNILFIDASVVWSPNPTLLQAVVQNALSTEIVNMAMFAKIKGKLGVYYFESTIFYFSFISYNHTGIGN